MKIYKWTSWFNLKLSDNVDIQPSLCGGSFTYKFYDFPERLYKILDWNHEN